MAEYYESVLLSGKFIGADYRGTPTEILDGKGNVVGHRYPERTFVPNERVLTLTDMVEERPQQFGYVVKRNDSAKVSVPGPDPAGVPQTRPVQIAAPGGQVLSGFQATTAVNSPAPGTPKTVTGPQDPESLKEELGTDTLPRFDTPAHLQPDDGDEHPETDIKPDRDASDDGYDSMSVVELQEMADDKGVDLKGAKTKADKVARLRAAAAE